MEAEGSTKDEDSISLESGDAGNVIKPFILPGGKGGIILLVPTRPSGRFGNKTERFKEI